MSSRITITIMRSRMSSNRRLARIYSFQFLYHLNFQEFSSLKNRLLDTHQREETLSYAITNFNVLYCSSDLPQGEYQDYSLKLIKKVLELYDDLYKKVRKYVVHKMNYIDSTILIQATCEMLYFSEVPDRVVIDEAIEMAKIFSTKQSSSFINAVLDKILKEANE